MINPLAGARDMNNKSNICQLEVKDCIRFQPDTGDNCISCGRLSLERLRFLFVQVF